MLASITNVKLPLVAEQIENVLDNYPHHPYQQAFAAPHLRQKLLAYVLSQVPAAYQVVEDQPSSEQGNGFQEQCSTGEHLYIEALVRRGIQHILRENAEWASRHIPEEVNPSEAASHWFG
jgi:hypothetical protein